jgi:hypothetical protein
MSARTERALTDVRALDNGLALENARARALENARALCNALVGACAFESVRDEARGIALALDQVGALNLDHENARTQARDVSLDLARAHILASARTQARHIVLDLARIGAFGVARASDLVDASSRARALATDLDHASALANARARASDLQALGRARCVAPTAARLLVAATRLLPAADRARHAEEYRSELADLAHKGAGRLCQLGYALRQLRSSPFTGAALRSAQRRDATP